MIWRTFEVNSVMVSSSSKAARMFYLFCALIVSLSFMPSDAAAAMDPERIKLIREQLSGSGVAPTETLEAPVNNAEEKSPPANPIAPPAPPKNPVTESDKIKLSEKRPLRTGDRMKLIVESCLYGCTISNRESLSYALKFAKPGSSITLAPGVYKIGKAIKLEGVGTAQDTKPITFRAEKLGAVRIESATVIAMRILGPNWIVENLEFVGICSTDRECEHAISITGPVSNTIIRNNRMRNFNSAIKAGRGSEERKFANDVLIEGNHIFNAAVRRTERPVTQVDINGGKRWKVIDNFIADFGKGGGNFTSYAGFLKSNSRDGLFARNLVICEWRHKGGERVGLSFGGGGTTDPAFCEDGDCSTFHTGGVMVNNIIMNCPDVGIYLNRSKDTKVYNNTLINTKGIDARFEITTAAIENNLVMGKISTRDSAFLTEKNNVQNGFFGGGVEFNNPDKGDLSLKSGGELLMQGELPPGVDSDFCGNPRTAGSAKIGAIAYGSGYCNVSERIDRALEGMEQYP